MDPKLKEEAENKRNNFEKELNEIEQKIIDLENYIIDKKKLINNIKKEIINRVFVTNEQLKLMNERIDKIKEEQLSYLKLNIPLLLKPEEKIISVIFITNDENIHYSIICKNTDNFSRIESLLYDKYPEYNNVNNIFSVNGEVINKSLSLEDNKIKNNDIIILKIN